MRASADQVRSASLDAVDAARGHALEVVSTGADLLTTTIDRGTATIETGIDRVVDRAPAIFVEVAPRRRSRWRLVVLAAVVLVVGAVVVRRLRGSGGETPGLIDLTEPRSPAGGTGAEVRFSVVPADGGGWDVVGSEAEPAVSHHSTQAEGVDRASALAADAGGGEVVIHGRDGHPRDTRRVGGPDDEAS